MVMIAEISNRVAQHTPEEINEQIRRKTEIQIKAYGCRPETIEHRLKELDREWDIERVLEANASTLLLLGLTLGTFVSRRWLLLPMLVGAFCVQHAFQGWCPPIEVLRRLGIRTAREIEEERVALKAIRGDFRNLPTNIHDSPEGFNGLLVAVRQ